jgi:hypothetical protein
MRRRKSQSTPLLVPLVHSLECQLILAAQRGQKDARASYDCSELGGMFQEGPLHQERPPTLEECGRDAVALTYWSAFWSEALHWLPPTHEAA